MRRGSAHFAGVVRAGVLAIVFAFCALPASAATITGDLTFSGDFEIASALGSATGLSFSGNDFDVDGSNGDFGSIAQGDIGSISDFDFSGTAVFSIAGFSFSIDNISIIAQTDAFLLLEGAGTVSGNGFDATTVAFSLSANVNGPIKNFSAGVTAVGTPIPIPGALLLFGSALGALGLRKR